MTSKFDEAYKIIADDYYKEQFGDVEWTLGRDSEEEEYLALVEKRKERERAIAEARDAVIEAAKAYVWADCDENDKRLYEAVYALNELELEALEGLTDDHLHSR
jgi:hypothetical protein